VKEKVWQIETEGKGHVVGYKAGVDDGEVLLDGKIVNSRGSSWMGVLIKCLSQLRVNLPKFDVVAH